VEIAGGKALRCAGCCLTPVAGFERASIDIVLSLNCHIDNFSIAGWGGGESQGRKAENSFREERRLMRVLHISGDAQVGGIESFLITLARNKAVDQASTHDFAFTSEGPAIEKIRLTGAQVHYLGGNASYKDPKALLLARRRLSKICRKYKYDVGVLHNYPYLIAAFADVLWWRKVKMVRYFHNETHPTSRLERLVRVVHTRFLDLSVFDSNFLRKCMPDKKGTVVYYPVDRQIELTEGKRNEIRARFATPAEHPLVIQVCRMAERKGHSRLLRALGTLKFLPWTCWIVGGPQREKEISYFDSLKNLTNELGIANRVRFLGTRIDVPELLAAADIFCHPNTYPPEPFGIAFVEALQAGLPVVTSAMGGAMEIVSEQCGFLVPPEDNVALADALRRLLTEKRLRQEMSASARTRGEVFKASVQIPLLNAALTTALASS
jgi:glycosyltransferase involved in cell wall biosynthesis